MSGENYLNPVFRYDFPDPFVWKFGGEYWAICTGFWRDGGVFGILKSRNLVNWTDCGSAMNPPPFPESPCYWAPEVFYENGKFYLYYSVGNEEFMEIRVAVADNPAGEYFDSGHKLTGEQFAIDAHVFVDDDNQKYLFYATDFLEHAHIGTGTTQDKMLSPFELEGNSQPVSRAKYNWQVYDPNRASKNFVRWHTIEGSAVLKRKNLYYQMFSGGNWQNISYGVSYATTRKISQTEEWNQLADGETTLPILRTIAEKVIGPGHNSVVRGTDNRQLYCVYHAWAADLSGRQMALDRLDFAGERMFVLGASFEPQPSPNQPTFCDFFDTHETQGLGANWDCENHKEWITGGGAAISNSALEHIETACRVSANSFLVETSAKAVEFSADGSAFGFALKQNGVTVLRCLILCDSKEVALFTSNESQNFALPVDFNLKSFHLWRVEVDNLLVKISLDEAVFKIEKSLGAAPNKFALVSQKMSAAFAGFQLTGGFEDLFDWENKDLAAHGWQIEKNGVGVWKIADDFLQCNSFAGETAIFKNLSAVEFELVVNARLLQTESANGCYGFVFQDNAESETRFLIETDNLEPHLRVLNEAATEFFDLPTDFVSDRFEQFRLRLQNRILQFQCGAEILGEIKIENAPTKIGLLARNAAVVFDSIRLTVISQ